MHYYIKKINIIKQNMTMKLVGGFASGLLTTGLNRWFKSQQSPMLNSNLSYDRDLNMRYELVRQEDDWFIENMEEIQ